MSATLLISLVWVHFFSDFVLQSRYTATNKSSNNVVLLEHVVIYSIPFVGFGAVFAIVNLVLHFIVDYITSRLTTRFWKKGETDKFFLTIGVDQSLHLTCLILTAKYLL